MSDASRRHDTARRGLGSDNQAGARPEVLEALALANGGHQAGYGADGYTEHLQAVFRAHFGSSAVAYPVFNGSGANVVSLQAMTQRWEAAICTEVAHVNTDECAAPERTGGIKLLPVPSVHGKLTRQAVETQARGFGDQHHAQPRVLSISQCTELGTCYTPAETADLVDHAHGLGLLVHVDGARLANAAASLGCSLEELTTDVGVDVLSFGGTKNSLMFGDCVVVLNPDAVRGLEFLRKSSLQLASKMRFISVQFEALLTGDLWLRNALHANSMATRLEKAVVGLDAVTIQHPVQANSVFATLPASVTEQLQRHFLFYVWNERAGEVRWMTSFDTTEEDIDEFASALVSELAKG